MRIPVPERWSNANQRQGSSANPIANGSSANPITNGSSANPLRARDGELKIGRVPTLKLLAMLSTRLRDYEVNRSSRDGEGITRAAGEQCFWMNLIADLATRYTSNNYGGCQKMQ